MKFFANLFGKSQEKRIKVLIASMDEDIKNGFSQELGNTSANAAKELATLGEIAVDQLTQSLHISSYAHWALGLIGGERAFQTLCQELNNHNPRRVAAAAAGLRTIGDPRALPFLRQHLTTQYAEVNKAVSKAIGDIERKQMGEHQWLLVDATDPYGQVKRVWSQFDRIRDDQSLRENAIQWHRSFVEAMPNLQFGSAQDRGHTWAMLGTLIYYFLNPQRSSFSAKCPEAAYCFEQCLKCTPNRQDIRNHLEQVK